jgi:ATP-dependent DNA ligase
MAETIPVFPDLYKEQKNCSQYLWKIEIQKIGDLYGVRTTHGCLENKDGKPGKIQVSEPKLFKGTTRSTPLEQATTYAKNELKKKKDDNYVEKASSVAATHLSESKDLEPVKGVSDPNTKGSDKKSKSSKKNASPGTRKRSNTPEKVVAIKNIKPMLADKFDMELYNPANKKKKYRIPFPAYVQRKLDGIRCISYNESGQIILKSRQGNKFEHFDEIRRELSGLFQGLPPTFYFDGELYSHVIPFNQISGLVRKKKGLTPKEVEDMKLFEYHIYDCFDTANLSLPFEERLGLLRSIFKRHTTSRCRLVETLQVDSPAEVKEMHDLFVKPVIQKGEKGEEEVVEKGYEGIMIRASEGPYEINNRSKYLQKYKEFMDEEFPIVGFEEAQGNDAGTIVWICETKTGKKFTARPAETREVRMDMFKRATTNFDHEYKGKLLTVKFFEKDEASGVPRFPIALGIRDYE